MARRRTVLCEAICCLALATGPVYAQELHRERVILPGDVIRISSDRDPEMCVDRVVGADGSVQVPGLGTVGVATLTTREIGAKLNELLLGPARDSLKVTSRFVKGAPVEILGAVSHPMKFRFAHAPILSTLVAIAAPADQADCSMIQISHADGSFEVVNLQRLRRLLDGDRVTVPFATSDHSVEVVGGVQRPAHLVIQGTLSVAEALDAAGGIAARGLPGRISVLRNGEQIPLQLPEDSGFALVAGDELRVDVSPTIQHVLVEGQVRRPGLIDLRPGMTLTQAIEAAGGVDDLNRSDLVSLSQPMEGSLRHVKLSLKFLYSHGIPDPVLSVDDVMHVGSLSKPKVPTAPATTRPKSQ